MSAMQAAEAAQTLYATLAQTFLAQQDVLNDLGASVDKPAYGDALANAFKDAQQLVLNADDSNFGRSVMKGARVLKTEAEPLLPFLLFELGKASISETPLSLKSFQEGLKNAVMSVVRVGGLRYGQGSLLDAVIPASETAHEAQTLESALPSAAKVAGETAQRAKHPGMTAVALILASLAEVFGDVAE